MKISDLIRELEHVRKMHGEIDVLLQNEPAPTEPVVGHEQVFVVPEEYEDGCVCNIRCWPY